MKKLQLKPVNYPIILFSNCDYLRKLKEIERRVINIVSYLVCVCSLKYLNVILCL